jgi:putative CRISPR-associated protein (TIGR02619 family)
MDDRRDTLICTVGTSLKTNLAHSADQGVRRELERGNAKGLALRLLSFAPDDRLCGAEINSIGSIVQKGYLAERRKLALLVSDTPDGMFIGQVLRHYYQHAQNPYRFPEVEVRRLEGLTDADHMRFRTEGLRNLVRAVAEMVNRDGSQRLVINATGGYKAQISFAGMIGQALEIPVCYLFERFSEVIELPPQPIALDLSFWLQHAGFFYELAADEAAENPVGRDPRFASLVDEIPVQGKTMIGLSPVGQLFHETFRHRFAVQREALLPPDSGIAPEDKAIKYEDANDAKHRGLKEYLERLAKVPYIKRIYTYKSIPGLSRPNYFRLSAKGEISQVEGGFSDGKKLTKFDLVTTADTPPKRDAVLVDLHERLLGR